MGIRQPASQSSSKSASNPPVVFLPRLSPIPPSFPSNRTHPSIHLTSLSHTLSLSRSLSLYLPPSLSLILPPRSDHNIALLHSGLFYFPSGLSNFAHPFPPISLAHTLIYCLTISLVRQTSQTQSLSFFSPIFVPSITLFHPPLYPSFPT